MNGLLYVGSNMTFELANGLLSRIAPISLWWSTLFEPVKVPAWNDAARSDGCITPAAAAAAVAARAAAASLRDEWGSEEWTGMCI